MVKIEDNIELKNSLKGDGKSDESLNKKGSEASINIANEIVPSEEKRPSASSIKQKFGVRPSLSNKFNRRSVTFREPYRKSQFKLIQVKLIQFMRSKYYLIPLITTTVIYLINIITHSILIELYKQTKSKMDDEHQRIQDYMKLFDLVNIVLCSIFLINIILNMVGNFKNLQNTRRLIDMILLFTIIFFEAESAFDLKILSFKSYSLKLVLHMIRMFNIVIIIQQFYDNRLYQSKADIKTNIMQVINHLFEVKNKMIDDDLTHDLQWTIKLIKSNNLFNMEQYKNGSEEQNKFLNQYDTTLKKTESQIAPRFSNSSQTKQGNDQLFGEKLKKINVNRQNSRSIQIDSIPIKCSSYLEKYIETFEFNVFKFDQMCNQKGLIMFIQYVFQKENFTSLFSLSNNIVCQFAHQVQDNYLPLSEVPYHNRLHGLDVAQTLYAFLKTCKLEKFAIESDMTKMACLIAAVAHDLNHPGLSNVYCINSGHSLAILYNDKSVLENFHASQLFSLILTQDSPFMECLSREQQDTLRTLVIKYILATDMAFHFQKIGKVNALFAADLNHTVSSEDKQLCLELSLHAADISNPAKHIDVYSQWVDLVMQEFFSIGDKERQQGLTISMLCDRNTVNIGKSQIGFIDFIVTPIFVSICQFMPEVKHHMKHLEINKVFYKLKQDKQEQQEKEKEKEKEQ